MQTCTRPSHFSVCNIEKLGEGLGTRLSTYSACIVLYDIAIELYHAHIQGLYGIYTHSSYIGVHDMHDRVHSN